LDDLPGGHLVALGFAQRIGPRQLGERTAESEPDRQSAGKSKKMAST